MIYFLKFAASLLLPPGLFIAVFFFIAYILWKKGQRRIAGVILGVNFLFYLLSTSLASGILIGTLESKYPQPSDLNGDCIVMLGGGALSGTSALTGKGSLSSSAESRLALTAQIYRQHPLPIIVSGGQVYSDSGNEAEIAQRELCLLGIPETAIIIENQSLNTRQNAQYTCAIMAERGLSRPILVTSAFHMERSVLNFQKEGIEVVPVSADFRVNQPRRFHWNQLEPSPAALENSNLFFREKLRSFVTCIFTK